MKTILIVLNPLEASDRFSDILSHAGYHVITAESGESALELVTSTHPDLILMAIVMPVLNGLQTAARLRALPGSNSAPIILLGSVTPIGINEEPMASLVDGYLSFDASADELLACVSTHLGSPSA